METQEQKNKVREITILKTFDLSGKKRLYTFFSPSVHLSQVIKKFPKDSDLGKVRALSLSQVSISTLPSSPEGVIFCRLSLTEVYLTL